MIERLQRLAAAGIQIIPADITSHFILERDGFVVFVERRGDEFGNVGAPGLMTERGFAAMIWRGGQAYFVAKGFEQAATEGDIAQIRAFFSDVQASMPGVE